MSVNICEAIVARVCPSATTQALQLAIDHAVHLSVLYLWDAATDTLNVLTGTPIDGEKKARVAERQVGTPTTKGGRCVNNMPPESGLFSVFCT